MKKEEALKIRDEERPKLIGQQFDKTKQGWEIIDVIVADHIVVGEVYLNMWDGNMSNEAALILREVGENDFDVFVISHQWSWGSGDLIFQKLESYKKDNHY